MYVRAELFSSLSPRFSFWPGNETLQFTIRDTGSQWAWWYWEASWGIPLEGWSDHGSVPPQTPNPLDPGLWSATRTSCPTEGGGHGNLKMVHDIPSLYVQHFTSSGCVKYIGVGSFSSMASRMRRFTPGQKNRRFNTKCFELRKIFNGYHTRTSHVVFLLHLESSC